MCKNKIIIKNKRYQPTKKNGYTKETPRDRRLSYIEIPCGECKECKKKRKEMWRLRIEKYAKSLSLVIPINELNKTDLEFFKTQLLAEKGEHKLNVYLRNPLDNSFIEARAMQQSININYQLIEKIHEFGKFEIYLN